MQNSAMNRLDFYSAKTRCRFRGIPQSWNNSADRKTHKTILRHCVAWHCVQIYLCKNTRRKHFSDSLRTEKAWVCTYQFLFLTQRVKVFRWATFSAFRRCLYIWDLKITINDPAFSHKHFLCSLATKAGSKVKLFCAWIKLSSNRTKHECITLLKRCDYTFALVQQEASSPPLHLRSIQLFYRREICKRTECPHNFSDDASRTSMEQL